MRQHIKRDLLHTVRRIALQARHPLRPTVNIVGTFRSGTNLLKDTLEVHYRVRVVFSRWHWKHGVPPTRPDAGGYIAPPVPMIVITKDPVALNQSLYRFWQKTRPDLLGGRDFATFICSDFIAHDNSFTPGGPRYLFETPTAYWNQFHYSYLQWPSAQSDIHFVRYEDLVARTDITMRGLAEALSLTRHTSGTIALPKHHVLPSSDKSKSSKGQAMTVPPQDTDPTDTAFIWSRVQADVAGGLGYNAPKSLVRD